MKNKIVYRAMGLIFALILIFIAFVNIPNFQSQIKTVGEFNIGDEKTNVIDIKSSGTSCLVLATKFAGQIENRYFIHCTK